MKSFRRLILAAVAVGAVSSSAFAGSIYLTGHDVLLHGGQAGYDAVIMDWLRGAGTSSEVAKGGYNIAVVGGGNGFASFTGASNFTTGGAVAASGNAITLAGTLSGYASATYYHATTADWSDILSKDLMIILSHTSCGGCDIGNDDVTAINAQSAAIATAFNAGMDIWGLSGASNLDYYDFLPPGAVSTGVAISGSSGFSATAAGIAIGITDGSPSMINGYATHNRFTGYAPAFTVFETRGAEDISIGIRDATIGGGGIGGPGGTVPEPGTLALFGLAAVGLALTRRRSKH